jgi:hypothetical protein
VWQIEHNGVNLYDHFGITSDLYDHFGVTSNLYDHFGIKFAYNSYHYLDRKLVG